VKKGEKKEPTPEPKAEKIQLKKPKVVEKPKEEPKEGVQLKPTPPKPAKEEDKKAEIKLKPVPPKEKEAMPKVGKCVQYILKILLYWFHISQFIKRCLRICFISYKYFY
jgi:hypothetical protein